jgi:hypothetical protein
LFAEGDYLPSEMGERSLHPMPVRVLMLDYLSILTFRRFPTGRVHWMNAKRSDVTRAHERRREQVDHPHGVSPHSLKQFRQVIR